MKRSSESPELEGDVTHETAETRTDVPHGLPDDLSLYLGKKTLVKLVLDAVQTINGETVDYTWFAKGGRTFQRPMMLTLLTYCYATGAYGAVDIELNIRHDQMTRYLCAKTYPDIDVIRGFRRLNRSQIRECLAVVLRRAWELRFADEADCGDNRSAAYLNLSSLLWPTPDFTREAEERVARAVRADSMALDE
jgi:transposase